MFGQNANISLIIPVRFTDTKLSFVDECILLSIFHANISQSVNSCDVKSKSILRAFRLLPYDIQFSLLSTYCMDACMDASYGTLVIIVTSVIIVNDVKYDVTCGVLYYS